MKTINGEKVTCSLVVDFDFTREECDSFLSAPVEQRRIVLSDLLRRKYPNPDDCDFNVGKLREAIGKALVQWRENELRQLPERSGSL